MALVHSPVPANGPVLMRLPSPQVRVKEKQHIMNVRKIAVGP